MRLMVYDNEIYLITHAKITDFGLTLISYENFEIEIEMSREESMFAFNQLLTNGYYRTKSIKSKVHKG